MRRPPIGIELAVVLCAFAAVIWVTQRSPGPDPADIKRPDAPAIPDAGRARGFPNPNPAGQTAAGNTNPAQGLSGRDAANRNQRPFQDNVELSSLLQQLLAGADPESAALLERGMKLLQAGDFAGSRREFQAILDNYPQSVLRPPAQWALALSYYREGGEENMTLSAGRFADFLARYSSYKPEVLVEAAQLDLAVICMNIMRTGPNDKVKIEAASAAARCLQTFLERSPENPQAPAARVSLLQIQSFLASMQEPGAANPHSSRESGDTNPSA